jgi:LPPG:FO 2-phospho-L-lactate transferase
MILSTKAPKATQAAGSRSRNKFSTSFSVSTLELPGAPREQRKRTLRACSREQRKHCNTSAVQIAILAGGVGGSKFALGVRRAYPTAHITVIANTADDITLHGLRICPDLDTIMYTLGGGADPVRGWGRQDESWRVMEEFAAYGVEPTWFSLGDRDIGTHLVRTQMLNAGYPLSEVTAALCTRWLADDRQLRLLPMTDDRVETHVTIMDPDAPEQRRAVHFQEYWVRLHAQPDALAVALVGLDSARPAPGVVDALQQADLILVAPSNPVVSIGPILAVPGLREALRAASAPVIGFAGILGGSPVLGMAHRLLPQSALTWMPLQWVCTMALGSAVACWMPGPWILPTPLLRIAFSKLASASSSLI